MPDPPPIGHGVDAWHCACHGAAFPVPSMAADCETRTDQEE